MYKKSEQLLDRALNSIPLASQTFSKSLTQYPRGVSPFFIEKGKGSRVWDLDGNEYIDFVNALLAITIGYCDADIDKAVQKQMGNGVIFSLPHKLEMEVAEKLIEIIPCAEKVRFAKNGTDATSASVRIARAYTGKEHIAVCGYHGWQDWYIASTTRDLGVPKFVKDLTHKFEYNNIDSLKKIFQEQELACVIMEPMNVEYPKDDFLKKVKELVHKNNALLIFDETITGFRYSLGGAQELFGVVPDLATFGKGITNGMPLGVLVGQSKYMKEFDKVFLSSTYAPEALTLAAASANIDFYKEHNVIDAIWEKGRYVRDGFDSVIEKHAVSKNVSLAGYPVRLMVNTHSEDGIQDPKLATLYQQEMFKNGILCFSGVLMLSYSHSKEDLDILIDAFDNSCKVIKSAIDSGNSVDEFLDGPPGAPVFKGLRERNAVSN